MGPGTRLREPTSGLGRLAALAAFAVLTGWGSARAQTLPAAVRADTLLLWTPAGTAPVGWRELATGERVATWALDEARVASPEATGRPVVDAPPGAIVASFGGSAWFAWPREPTVWTAPRAGALVFGINCAAGQEVQRPATAVVVDLGGPGSAAQRSFPRPSIELERAGGGVIARYADRAGFGLVPGSLRVAITTNRGVRYDLAAWATPGPQETVIPLPPPDLPLPPGLHTLSVTIEDRLGNPALPATIVFDAAPRRGAMRRSLPPRLRPRATGPRALRDR